MRYTETQLVSIAYIFDSARDARFELLNADDNGSFMLKVRVSFDKRRQLGLDAYPVQGSTR